MKFLPWKLLRGGTTGQYLKRTGTGPEDLGWDTPSSQGGISDGDKGDITVSASGATWTIDNNAVTLAKIEDIATDSFIGRDTAGTGDPEVLSVATAKTLLNLTGTNSGDVTLAGTPDYITIAGQTITRGLIDLTTDVTGDLPLSNVAQASAASRLLGRGSAAGAGDYQEITVGGGLSFSGTVLSSADTNTLGPDGDKGDITVGGTGTTLTIDNDAVTYAKMQNASVGNVVLARAAATSGDYSEVAVGASQLLGRGSTGDIAAITLGSNLSMSGTTLSATGGGGNTFSTVAVSGQSDVVADTSTDTLTFAAGTGITLTTNATTDTVTIAGHAQSHAITSTSDHTAGNWKVLYTNGSGQVIELALGSSGTFLQSNGASSAPSFATVATNPWTVVVATADQAVTNSAVLTDSTYLQFTTTANTNYHIRLRVLMNSGNATADIKYRVTHAGTTTRVRRVRTYSVPNGTSATFPTVLPATAFDSADQTLLATVTGDSVVYEDIYLQVGASGGIFKIAFAQNTQTAAASVTLYEGSYLEYMTT